MFRKLACILIVLFIFLSLTSATSADLSVGVKKGDWIEYSVTYTDSPSQGHDVNWARMEVTDVQGTNISVSITSRYPNGSTEVFNSTLNLATGKLIDDFIIPANLNAGDTFLDQNLGNVTISRSDQQTYAGAMRTVLHASASENTYVWDKATGVSVEGTSQQPDYSMHTIVEDTNMWQPSHGLDLPILLLAAAIILVVIAALAVFAIRYRKKKTRRLNPISIVLILGLVAFILYIVFFINPTQVIGILSKINLVYFAGAFVAYSLFALFSSLVWQRLLSCLSVKISKRKALLFTWVGLFFEATVPQLGWSGEVSKTYMLTKDSKVDAGKIVASVVGQKIFTMTTSVVALTLGLSLVLVNYSLPLTTSLLIAFILSLSILGLGIVYYVSIKPTATKTLLGWAIKIMSFFRKRWNPQDFRSKGEETLGNFHIGISQLKADPRALIVPIACAVISFIFEISVIFLTFMALGYPVPVDKVLIVFTLTGALQTVGVTIFGFTEIVMTSIFTFLGIPVDLSFSVTLLTRVVNLWFRLVVSYLALQWAGIKIIRQTSSVN